MEISIYQSIYNLINDYVFGNAIVSGSFQELATVLMSLGGCVFCIAIPFIVVFYVIRGIVR